MTLFLAAIGATVAALLEVLPYVGIGDAHPHPVLVFGIIWVAAAGLDRAMVWAFVGGIVLDALASRPFGLSTFTLLLAVGATQGLRRAMPRLRLVVPIIAVALLSGPYSVAQLVLYGALRSPLTAINPMETLLPGIIYDVVVAILFGPLLVALHARYAEQERLDW